MDWRSWFPKKEKFTLDGREVLIVNRTNFNFSQLREVILLVCQTEKMAWHFPKLTFVIKPFKDNDLSGRVNTSDLTRNKAIISLNSEIAQNQTETKEYYNLWRGNINHELTHLFHNSQTNTFQHRLSSFNRLLKVQSKKKYHTDSVALREQLFLFMRKIFTEGVAQYYQEYSQGNVFFSQEVFQEYYLESKKGINQIVQSNFAFLMAKTSTKPPKGLAKKVKELIDSLKKLLKLEQYTTGFHMVYTILYIDHKTSFDDILQLQPFEFVRKYEDCMTLKGLQPVISVTSGKGIFDYKTILLVLTTAARKSEQ